jgi:multiple sugar transport system substrate-binding protein
MTNVRGKDKAHEKERRERMNRTYRWTLVVLLLVLTVVIAFAGGAKETKGRTAEEGIIKLKFWHHEAPAHRVAAFQKIIDLYEKEYPNVSLEQEIVMWEDAWPKTIAAVESGDGPAFQFSSPELVITNYLLHSIIPLTDIATELDKKYKFLGQQESIYSYEGELWGVNVFTMVFLLTTVPSLLEKYVGTTNPPKTWDEYLEYAKKMYDPDNGVYGVALSGAVNLLTAEQIYPFMAAVNSRFFDDDGNVVFDSPETIRALKMYNDLYQYNPPGAQSWSWGEIELNLEAKKAGLTTYFPSVQRRFALELDSDDYAGFDQPYPPDGKPGTLTYPNEIHVYKWTKDKPGHLKATYNFIRFIMRPEINAILTTSEPGGFYPTTRAAMNAPEFWNDAVVSRFEKMNKAAVNALNYATLFGFESGRWVNLGIGDIIGADVLSQVVNKVVTGEMTAEKAAAWGQAEMEKYSKPVPRSK